MSTPTKRKSVNTYITRKQSKVKQQTQFTEETNVISTEIKETVKLIDFTNIKSQKLFEDMDIKFSDDEQKQLPVSALFDCKFIPQKINFREGERERIEKFLKSQHQLNVKDAQFLMVTGLPGSGKTLLINKILDDNKGIFRSVRINAMRCKSYLEFLQSVNDGLKVYICAEKTSVQKTSKQDLKAEIVLQLKNLSIDKRETILMIDEFECLFKKTQKDALDLLPLSGNSDLYFKIIGISNDIEFLQQKSNHLQIELPHLENIVFKPYTQAEVQSILEDRLTESKYLTNKPIYMDQDAIKFCAGQAISSKGGDLRNVLDLCKRVVKQKKEDLEIKIEKSDFAQITGQKQQLDSKQQLVSKVSLQQQIILVSIYLILKKQNVFKTYYYYFKETIEIELQQIDIKIRWVKDVIGLDTTINSDQLNQDLQYLQDYNLIQLRETKAMKHGFRVVTMKVVAKISKEDIFYTFSNMEIFKRIFQN